MAEMMNADAAGLTDTQAKLEASRCLMCEDPPCVAACPAQVPVKHFIRAIRFDSPRRAINLIRDRNVLAGVCGLACPVDELCVGACRSTDLTAPIAIGSLQHYAAVTALRSGWLGRPNARKGEKVAIIGAGPSGLAAAAELARRGHRPVVFEKNPRAGGICTYGVPKSRVPQELVAGEVEYVRSLGVEIKTSSPFVPDQTVDDLFAAGYKAVYVSTGAQEAMRLGIPGESLEGVTTWKALLDALSVYELGEGDKPLVAQSVIIVGGGSVAMDVACATRELGASEIDVVCLEAPREMPAYHDELDEAWDAGVRFHTRSMPLEITAQGGRVTGLKAVRIRWREPDRFVPSNAEAIERTEYWLPGEMVVLAIGARPVEGLARILPGVTADGTGRIVVDPEAGATGRPGVFAGGDVASGGGATIVQAVAEGKRAGEAIDAYLQQSGDSGKTRRQRAKQGG
jgi:glutamate synthase (NADPH/NADH) small chain